VYCSDGLPVGFEQAVEGCAMSIRMIRMLTCLLALGVSYLAATAETGDPQPENAQPAMTAGERADLSWVQSWAIQLQDADIGEIAASPYDLVVIDYAWDGTDATAHTFAEIEQLKSSGKLVLAYLPLGELSDFRFYWQDDWRVGSPSFIGPPNPDWPGAYKSLYWHDGFYEKVIEPSLDRILAAGFDGVWADTADSYWFWYEHGYDLTESADRMAALVRYVAGSARGRVGEHFIVCPNNGLGMMDAVSSEWRDHYLSDIDAVNVESLFFNYWSLPDQTYLLKKLAEYSAAGKTIFNLDYMGPESYGEYYANILRQSFDIVGYAGHPDMALDELIPYDTGPFGRDTAAVAITADYLDAEIVLDAAVSSKYVEDALAVEWFDGETHLASGSQATATLPVGTHDLTLVVDDGSGTVEDQIRVAVVTTGDAADEMLWGIAAGDVDMTMASALTESFRRAAAAFNAGNDAAGVSKLLALQQKIDALSGKEIDASLGAFWIARAQAIIDSVSNATIPAKCGKLRARRKCSFGKVRVGEQRARVLEIKNRGHLPLPVHIVEPTDSTWLLIGGPVVTEIPAHSVLEVSVQFTPDAPGKAKGTLIIRSGDRRKREVTVRLRGKGN
jgi:cysteinyl-tRNA synthetase